MPPRWPPGSATPRAWRSSSARIRTRSIRPGTVVERLLPPEVTLERLATAGDRPCVRDPLRRRAAQPRAGGVPGGARAGAGAARHHDDPRQRLRPGARRHAGARGRDRRRERMGLHLGRAAHGRRRDRLLLAHPASARRWQDRGGGRPHRLRSVPARDRRAWRRARTAARLPDRQPRLRLRGGASGARHLPRPRQRPRTRRWTRSPGPGERRRAAHLPRRRSRAGRGLPARLGRRPVRRHARPRARRSPARGAALRRRRRARDADAGRRAGARRLLREASPR